MAQKSRLDKFLDQQAIELPTGRPILCIRPTPNPAYKRIDPDQTTCIQSFGPTCDQLGRLGFKCADALPKNASLAFVELTRSKPENLANIARAYSVLDAGALLVIDGAKTDGIDSISKSIRNLATLDGSYSKSHGKTIWLTKSDIGNPFQEWENLADPSQNQDGFWTRAGVFSADGIDPASAQLIRSISKPLKGTGADLGAGWGFLSNQVLGLHPEVTGIDLYEAENNALECARRNVADDRANFYWENVLTFDAKPQYDFIVMNPPFHTSRKAEPSLGRDFIAKAAKMLAPKGQLWMVANTQLAYEATLDDCFGDWSYLDQTAQFKTIMARRPK